MRASMAAMALAVFAASAASAQLAPLETSAAPGPVDGLAGLPNAGAVERRDESVAAESARACREQARSFRYRNSQSPAERRQALAACIADAARRERVEVAGP